MQSMTVADFDALADVKNPAAGGFPLVLKQVELRGVARNRSVMDSAIFVGCRLLESGFIDCDLQGLNFVDTEFRDCAFVHCNFRKSEFRKCDMSSTAFIGCNWSRVEARECEIRGCNLTGSILSAATMIGCDLRETNLDYVLLSGAYLSDCALHAPHKHRFLSLDVAVAEKLDISAAWDRQVLGGVELLSRLATPPGFRKLPPGSGPGGLRS